MVGHAAKTILVPAMKRLLPDNPDIAVELTVDYGLIDVVADRFDTGVRLGGWRVGERHDRGAHRARHSYGDRRLS